MQRLLPRLLPSILVLASLAFALSAVFAGSSFIDGPPPSRTGAWALGGKPAENTCSCHNIPAGNLNTPGGGVQILDLPSAGYEPGTVYPIRLSIYTDSTAQFPQRRWGFEMTAVKASDGTGAGSWVLPPGDTMKVIPGFNNFATRSYIQHNYECTREGISSPVEWTVLWQAPATDVGKILFFASGNAANGNIGNDGDYIFTGADSIVQAAVPSARTTWGALKSRFR